MTADREIHTPDTLKKLCPAHRVVQDQHGRRQEHPVEENATTGQYVTDRYIPQLRPGKGLYPYPEGSGGEQLVQEASALTGDVVLVEDKTKINTGKTPSNNRGL